MKFPVSIILLAFTLSTPLNVFAADKANDIKALSEKFYLEIYYDGMKEQDRLIYVDLLISNRKEVQWTTVFLNHSRCIKKRTARWVPIVSRWDKAIYDVNYDTKSFQLKLKFDFVDEEVLVRGDRMLNGEFKVEGTGFRKDLSTNRNVKVEWKSIHD